MTLEKEVAMHVSPTVPLIAASLMAADYSRLGEEVKSMEMAGADIIHFDITDGHFVPNLSMGPDMVRALRPYTRLPFDVHLMISNPMDFLQRFAEAGADWLSVHTESEDSVIDALEMIHSFDKKAGVVLNPETPESVLEPLWDHVSFVNVMTVNPGFGGAVFIPEMLEKVRRIKQTIQEKKLSVLVKVDGGINEKTAPRVINAGADILVSGSALFKGGAASYKNNIKKIKGSIII
jgi:ribulose-phosphate 3-epimerase